MEKLVVFISFLVIGLGPQKNQYQHGWRRFALVIMLLVSQIFVSAHIFAHANDDPVEHAQNVCPACQNSERDDGAALPPLLAAVQAIQFGKHFEPREFLVKLTRPILRPPKTGPPINKR